MTAFYLAFRAVASWLLTLFYRVELNDPNQGLSLTGPIVFIGNHPNGLVDPGLMFVLAQRQVTFLAKAPLFSIPVLGLILRGMKALPVFRKKDDPSQMNKNSGTLEASAQALVSGGAITIFPEGISHSEPSLQELKTGAARIAFMAAQQGAAVRVVPVGFTYSEKNRYRSVARLEVGAPLEVANWGPPSSDEAAAHEQARALTAAMAQALRALTINLEQWEDLPLLKTAESLYALRAGEAVSVGGSVAERLRAFARGMQLLRAEQPVRFEQLKSRVLSLQRRLALTTAEARELRFKYRPATVMRFIASNLLWLTLLPVFLLGMVAFVVPFWVPATAARLSKADADTEATVKVLVTMLIAPLWAALMVGFAWWGAGVWAAVATALGVLPLALFTRYFFERRTEAIDDARTFFVLGSRRQLKTRLLAEASELAGEIEAVAAELRERVAG